MYTTIDQIERLVRGFETCALPPSEFDHRGHITVALWYLARYEQPEATDRMRAGLHHFLAHGGHGLGKYNETITLFWMKLLSHFLDAAGRQRPLLDITNRAVAELGSMRFVFSHYSKELVFSDAARRAWVEPDLLPLAF
jgi:hypothetical protein